MTKRPHHALPTRLLPLLALAAALCAGDARAGRPLVTETADVIGAGDCELDAAIGRWRESEAPSPTLVDAVFSCGWGGHSQLGVLMAGARADGATDKLAGLGGKTMLVMPQGDITGFALAYSIWRSNDAGEGWNQGGGRIFGVATRELGMNLVGHANLGWLRTGRNRLDHTTWSLGIEGEGPLAWAADVFGDDRSRPWLSGGVTLPLGETFSANLGYAQQFESPRVHLWTLGFKIEFK
jgi:hypothetical protein